MPRFFIDIRLPPPSELDLESSDLRDLVAIREQDGVFEIEKTMFDFSIDIVDPHRANNRIHTVCMRKAQVDGFIANVLRPGRHCREVTETEYTEIYERMSFKSKHLERKKGRKMLVTFERNEGGSKLQ